MLRCIRSNLTQTSPDHATLQVKHAAFAPSPYGSWAIGPLASPPEPRDPALCTEAMEVEMQHFAIRAGRNAPPDMHPEDPEQFIPQIQVTNVG
jgi:hypothetical protein